MVTNTGAYTMKGVDLGETYVIEIVPSSTLGNGSATTTIISKFHISYTDTIVTV